MAQRDAGYAMTAKADNRDDRRKTSIVGHLVESVAITMSLSELGILGDILAENVIDLPYPREAVREELLNTIRSLS